MKFSHYVIKANLYQLVKNTFWTTYWTLQSMPIPTVWNCLSSIPIPHPLCCNNPPPQPNLNVIYTGGINVCVRYLILKLRGVAWESSISHKCKKFYTKNLQNIYTFIYSRKTIWYLNYLKYLNLIEKFNHKPSFKCIILKTITTKFS